MPPPAADCPESRTPAAAFAAVFGGEPSWVVFAPGRVNLIGEHTDYNGGFVLPLAIEPGIYLAARVRDDRQVHLRSVCFGGAAAVIDLDRPPERGEPGWSNYVRGVIAGMGAAGARLPGFEVLIDSTLPAGGGVSSSAALEVAAATLCEGLSGMTLDPVAKALLCQKAEHDFAGTPCGIMDQFAVVMGREGHALLIDCQSRETRHVPVPAGEVAILVVNTMVKHALNDGGYRSRRDDCYEAARLMGVADLRGATPELLEASRARLPERLFRRARHVITENGRTLAAVEALERGDWAWLGTLMAASHVSLRDDFEVSCAELDAVVAAAGECGREGGVYGCRMTGGGFGGCCVALVDAARAEPAAAAITASYRRQTGIEPAAFVTKPSGGPRILRQP